MKTTENDGLVALLDALRDAESRAAAPGHVEVALMRAWDASHAPGRALPPVTAVSRFGALAAAAVLAAGLSVLGGHLRSATAVDPFLATDAAPVVILIGEPILDGEHVRLVRTRMPAATLHALGVRSTAFATGDVDVDVVVGEDGVARAVSLNP
jgi:hypothetical protein